MKYQPTAFSGYNRTPRRTRDEINEAFARTAEKIRVGKIKSMEDAAAEFSPSGSPCQSSLYNTRAGKKIAKMLRDTKSVEAKASLRSLSLQRTKKQRKDAYLDTMRGIRLGEITTLEQACVRYGVLPRTPSLRGSVYGDKILDALVARGYVEIRHRRKRASKPVSKPVSQKKTLLQCLKEWWRQ